MTIAKGCTNCEAERDTIAQGFHEMLKVLKQAKGQTEVQAKAALYDIINDKSLSDDERWTQMRPFNDLFSEQEESDIRIRRTILIGLFSFWELSLKYICAYYKLDVAGMKGIKLKKESQLKNDRILFSENDYLKAIFHSERPNIVDVISSKIKELRNYMTHGSADKNRQAVIDSIISEYPDFFVKKTHDGYYITSYDGLDNILKIINDGLIIAETTAKTLNVQIN